MLRDLLRLFRPPEGRGATRDEVTVLRWILGLGESEADSQDPRLDLLAQQLERAADVIRESPEPDTYRASPTWTYDNLTFPLEVDRIVSEPIRVIDAVTGRELEFRAVVGRSGFLRALEGRALDGRAWPDNWGVGSVPSRTSPSLLTLPSLAEQEAFEKQARSALGNWLGIRIPPEVTLLPPVTPAAIGLAESKLGGRFPRDARTLLSHTDGFETATLRVLGHRDVYSIDLPWPAVVLAWDTDDRSDFMVVAALRGDDGGVYRVNGDSSPSPLAPNFRSYLRRRLRQDR